MRVLVLGKGGREHALAWKLSCSPRASVVFVAPGNAGTDQPGPGSKAELANVELDYMDFASVIAFAKKESIGLVVVGPEDPLAAGIVDALKAEGIKAFGPSKDAARLEGSKGFAKEVMRDANILTPEAKICDHPDIARTFIETREYPLVIKADGLAGGKGVMVCSTKAEALAAVERIMVREEFGREAGRRVLVERRLMGYELSVLALVSGRTILRLPVCQDHKAVYNDDQGPNTGGMGVFCPADLASPQLLERIDSDILVPTVHEMKRRKSSFKGILYAGIMMTNQGPRVLEFNVRLGDPETQPLLMRLKTDLLDLLEACVDERLEDFEDKVVFDPRSAVAVVASAKGYPGKYLKGDRIDGLDDVSKLEDVMVFHAGTKRDGDRIVTDGGRVLAVTALGDDLSLARKRAYESMKEIRFLGMHYRRDIGARKNQPAPQ